MKIKQLDIDVSTDTFKYDKFVSRYYSFYYPYYKSLMLLKAIVRNGDERFLDYYSKIFDETVQLKTEFDAVCQQIGKILTQSDYIINVSINMDTDILSVLYLEV